MKKKLRVLLVVLFVMIVGGIGAFTWYVNDYYHATVGMEELMEDSNVEVDTIAKDYLVFSKDQPSKGFIFYPGGKVEYTAYAPLMEKLAQEGFLCVLVKMPCNLAVFNQNAANGIKEKYPQIEDWYIGGHSLGGAMAASYVSKHTNDYQGLILLAAYSTKDLSNSALKVITISGTNDLVLNKEKVKSNANKLPADTKIVTIKGGCHSYFGDYGEQDGDGTATITREEQINRTVEVITQWAE